MFVNCTNICPYFLLCWRSTYTLSLHLIEQWLQTHNLLIWQIVNRRPIYHTSVCWVKVWQCGFFTYCHKQDTSTLVAKCDSTLLPQRTNNTIFMCLTILTTTVIYTILLLKLLATSPLMKKCYALMRGEHSTEEWVSGCSGECYMSDRATSAHWTNRHLHVSLKLGHQHHGNSERLLIWSKVLLLNNLLGLCEIDLHHQQQRQWAFGCCRIGTLTSRPLIMIFGTKWLSKFPLQFL